MKVKKKLTFFLIIFLFFMFHTTSNAFYPSVNVVISQPEEGRIYGLNETIPLRYTVYDVYMGMFDNRIIANPVLNCYTNGVCTYSENLGYIWPKPDGSRGDWIAVLDGAEFEPVGGARYDVEIVCVPMNLDTYEKDKRIPESSYLGKRVTFYVYEDRDASASFTSTFINKKVGDANFTNTFKTSSDGSVSYTSNNPKVAKVDSSTGEVSIVGTGNATITAKVNRSYIYREITAKYDIKVVDDKAIQKDEPKNDGNKNNTTKKAAVLNFANASIEKNKNDKNFTNKLSASTDGAITYSIGNTSVASIDSKTGEVTIKGIGTAIITATSAETDVYQSGKATYKLTVKMPESEIDKPEAAPAVSQKKNPSMKFANSYLSKTVGDKKFTNKLTFDTDGLITYASSNSYIAKVDAKTGEVTITGEGTATIVAYARETDNYKKSSASYTLQVTKQKAPTMSSAPAPTSNPVATTKPSSSTKPTTSTTTKPSSSTKPTTTTKPSSTNTTTTKKDPGISYATTSLTKKYPSAAFQNPLTNPNNLPITYSSSNSSIAEVSSTGGGVKVKGTGTCTITATFAGNSTYKAKSVSYTLTVTSSSSNSSPSPSITVVPSTSPKPTPTPVTKKDPGISYATTSLTKRYPSVAFQNPLTNPNGLTITYSSSNTNVAEVSSTGGGVKVKGTGTCTITATFAGNSTYKAKSVSYTLIVN